MMTKYSLLLNILDVIVREADVSFRAKYNLLETDQDKINQTRARAFIHLYLKVSFGILDFRTREYYITDGSYDGGIDGYYINPDSKTIYFIQSKFRTTQKNFEQKKIELKEILIMDVSRIVEGEDTDESGNQYSGKIKQLQRDLSKIDDIARYKYQVVLLANIEEVPQSKLRMLSGGYPIEVFDYQKCYERLVFPVISGTYFNASDLNIYVDLSNKSAGSKISYSVQTKHSECEITVLFVPTLEIAKILSKYKNSILKYNPRSYLEMEGQKVNSSIRETIMNLTTNEFALFNNGITMLSDETYINEKIGQKFKAQLTVKNPQIINGGQTSFTLSRIYEECNENEISIFENKEVLLKIITIVNGGADSMADHLKLKLIEDISTATNQQTPVNNADRFSNEELHIQIQKKIFDQYGLLYERKRGEFGDGVHNGYLNSNLLVERNLFFRIYYAANGKINKAVEKRLFIKEPLSSTILDDEDKLDNFYFGFLCFRRLYTAKKSHQKVEKGVYGMVYAMTQRFKPKRLDEYEKVVDEKTLIFKQDWRIFVNTMKTRSKLHTIKIHDQITQQVIRVFNEVKWYSSDDFEKDVVRYAENAANWISQPLDEADNFLHSVEESINERRLKLEKKIRHASKFLGKLRRDAEILTVKISNAPSNEEQKRLSDELQANAARVSRAEESILRSKTLLDELPPNS